jgi:hypothetical protein
MMFVKAGLQFSIWYFYLRQGGGSMIIDELFVHKVPDGDGRTQAGV